MIDGRMNYVTNSFKNSCTGNRILNHIESDSLKLSHDTSNNGLCVLGNDDIVLKEEQYEALLAAIQLIAN